MTANLFSAAVPAAPFVARHAADIRMPDSSCGDKAAPDLSGRMAGLPLFADLPAPVLRRLAAAAVPITVPRGATLFAPGERADGLWVLVRGRLQLVLPSSHGDSRLLATVEPGETVGEAALFGDATHATGCRVAADADLLFLPRGALQAQLARCGPLAQRFLRTLADRLHMLIRDIAQVSTLSAENRIASLLVQLMESDPQAGVVKLPDRKREIASRLSLAPETFSRALRAFQDDGLIRVDGYQVQILDSQRLRATAQPN